MAVARITPKQYTAEEYLDLEEAATFHSEYFQGEIFAMAGGSYNHDVIAGNIYAALHQFGQTKPCTAFTSNMKVLVEAHGLYTYPDAMLVCGKPQFQIGRTDTIVNPLLLVEVLSKSTESYDHEVGAKRHRGKKFDFYRSIPTFEHYLLIEQDQIHVEYYQRLADGRWILTVLKARDEALRLLAIEFEVTLYNLYTKVDWFAA
jgi:Uma2 family endonuclease